jgi:hypothetical protein
LVEFNSVIVESNFQFHYSILLTKEFAEKLDTTLIDNFLSSVIDPLRRTVTKDELIQNFNYPPEDVFEIDIDWL